MRKSRWEDMRYFESIDCWVVIWEGQMGYKVRCGDWFDLHLGNGRKLTCSDGTRKSMVCSHWR